MLRLHYAHCDQLITVSDPVNVDKAKERNSYASVDSGFAAEPTTRALPNGEIRKYLKRSLCDHPQSFEPEDASSSADEADTLVPVSEFTQDPPVMPTMALQSSVVSTPSHQHAQAISDMH